MPYWSKWNLTYVSIMILLELYKSRQTQYIHWTPILSQSQLSCPPKARTDHGHTRVLKEKSNHRIITDLPTMGRQWLPLRRPAQTGSTIATWVFGPWLCVCAKRPSSLREPAARWGAAPRWREAPRGANLSVGEQKRRILGGYVNRITYWGKIPFRKPTEMELVVP